MHSNPNLPSTVQQISNYLAQNGGAASSTALYLVSSGGNDITYANNNFSNLAGKEAYLTSQISSLVAGLQSLKTAGALNFLVYNEYGNGTLASFYNSTLVSDLATAGIKFTLADIQSLVNTVEANPTAYGFTAATVMPGACRDLLPARPAWQVWARPVGGNFAGTRRHQTQTLLTSELQTRNRQVSFLTTSISPQPDSRLRPTTSLIF